MNDQPLHLLNAIGGSFQEALSGERLDVESPGDDTLIATIPNSSAADVDLAVAAAGRAFEAWSRTTPRERQTALLRLADAIEARIDELSELEAIDAGKPVSAVPEEIEYAADNMRFFAGAARCLEGRAAGEYMEARTSMIRREPLGVVGSIAPWNYPLLMAVWKISPALAAGNTVVLKPAPTTSVTALKLAEIAAEILPDGVLNVVSGGDEVGQALVRHPDVAMVSLTGSPETGKWIARNAGDTLKRVHLELGGNAPVIIFEDADLSQVLPTVALCGYTNAGQDCTAATRVIASQRVVDDVVSGLADEARNLVIGDVSDPATTLGPVNSAGQRQRVLGFFDRMNGGEIVTGGAVADRPGQFVEPTVVTGLAPDSEMVQQEIFGPVLTIQPFRDEEQVIQWANSTKYGLSASVWTRNVARALRVSSQLRFGVVWINDHMSQVSEMPHGGLKESGYGKDLSIYALEEYTLIKHVMASWNPV